MHTASRGALGFGAILLAFVTGACGSSSSIATQPTPGKCQVALSGTDSAIGASGGTGKVVVTTEVECAWTASTDTSWISDLSPSSSQGKGEVAFHVSTNPAPSSRQGAITINGQRVDVRQDPAACRYDVAANTVAFAAGGGSGTAAVTTLSGCAWTAASGVSWIQITTGAAGNGASTIAFQVAANNGDSRSATITVAGQAVVITQAAAAAPCLYAVSANDLSIGATGTPDATVAVTAANGCVWTAASHADWITIKSGASGNGNGTVSFAVAANGATPRSGTMTIASKLFTVTQAAGTAPTPPEPSPTPAPPAPPPTPTPTPTPACSYAVASTSSSLSAAGSASATVTVTAAAGCAWTAASGAPWITISAGASGSGNGSVVFAVAANTGDARTGTLTVASQTVTIAQAAGTAPLPPPPCVFVLSRTSASVPAAGVASESVSVTTANGCAWTAASNASWITTAVSAASGNGSVTVTVAANSGGARTGTVTIAGQTFTVTQSAACSYAINPTSQSVGAAGGPVSVTVSTAAGCAWSATSIVSWLGITLGASGSGNGTVTFVVSPNAGSVRTSTLLIANQTLTVTQSAACSYSIDPTDRSIGGPGGNTTFSVSAGAGCAWTATSNVNWITITSGASGTGNGTVAVTVAANPGNKRSGTVTAAGRTFTIDQAKH